MRLRNKLRSLEKVTKYSSLVVKALSESEKGATAVYLIERAENALGQLSGVLEDADGLQAKLAECRYEILDIAERVRDALDPGEIGDPAEKLTQIEARLSLIEKLERKYGASIPEIKAKRAEIGEKIASLEDGDFRLAQLEKERDTLAASASEFASRLHEKRTRAAEGLSRQILESLRFLDMPKVRFRIAVTPLRENGAEEILNVIRARCV